MNKNALLLALIILSPLLINAQNLSADISKKFSDLLNQSDLKFASLSLTVLDANSGNIIFQKDGNQALSPASTQKLITSSAALDILENDYKFSTNFYYTGNIVNKTLNGNIIIIGEGDPTLGSQRWNATESEVVISKILTEINKLGIEKINGDIIADISNWDNQNIPNGWIWQDIGNYYGAATSPICWQENAIKISFKNTKVNEISEVNSNVPYPFIILKNNVITSASGNGDDVYAYFEPNKNQISLKGALALDYKKPIVITNPNPALSFAFDIYSNLKANNISVNGYRTLDSISPLKPSKTLFYKLESPPLSEIVYHLNQKSVNLFAEQIVRKLATSVNSLNKISNGLEVVKNYLSDNDINKKSLFIYDGSGLSPQNKLNTYSMAYLLFKNKQKPWFSTFYKSLPEINGIKMKSGTIANVLAYAGYHSYKNNLYCFSIMLNNYNGDIKVTRQKLFNVLNVLKD